MMEFIKKNKLFTIVVIATVLISLTLVFFDVSMHFEVAEANESIQRDKENLEKSNRKHPAPVLENVKRIEADKIFMTNLSREMQKTFGKFYRNSLKAFVAELGTTEEAITSAFAAFYEKLPQNSKAVITGTTDVNILEDFLKSMNYDKTKLPAAVKAAIAELKKISIENVSEANVSEYLLAALGLPRTAHGTYFKVMLKNTQEALLNAKAVPGAVTLQDIENVTFDEKSIPGQKGIPDIILQMQIIEDLLRRVNESGISALTSLQRPAELSGEKINNNFRKFTYRVNVVGNMVSLRKFLNSLQMAISDNVVYKVDELAINRVEKENVDTLSATSAVKEETSPQPQPPPSASLKTAPVPDDAFYGRPVIGLNKKASAELTVSCIVYIGDFLKRNEQDKN